MLSIAVNDGDELEETGVTEAVSDATSWKRIVCFWCRLTQVNLNLRGVK